MPTQYRLEFDMRGSGWVVNETAGEALGNHKLVYRGADSLWYHADADAAATMPVLGITMGAIPANRKGEILREGYIGDTSWTWTVPNEIYASTTAGELTQTIPAGVGDIIQVVAMPVSQVMIYFNSDLGNSGTYSQKEEFYPPVESDAYIGQHYGAQMLDAVDTIVGFEFAIPGNFHSLLSAVVMVVQTTAATPNMVWSATTDFAEACSTENYNNHQDTTGSQTSQVLQSDVVCLDVSSALTGIAAGDLVGMEFLRDGDNAADTVGGPVWCVGLRLRYR